MVKRISYFGPAGTYTEEAARLYDPQADLHPFPTIPAVFLAVAGGVTDEGVVPIENSLEGSVVYTLDLLINDSELSIYHEIVLPIEHCLMVLPGTTISDIGIIYSHPNPWPSAATFWKPTFPMPDLPLP